MIEISENIYYFPGAVHIVYIRHGELGIMIDGGLDDQRMKKVVKELEEREWKVTHLILTHAHADHFGGVSWLQRNYQVYTYAPKIEASIMESPILEPLYLFSGAAPLHELRNKFLEAAPIKIDEVIDEGELQIGSLTLTLHLLPGHSYYQLGVGVSNQLLYAADSYFSSEVIDKHGVPFLVDARQTLESLEHLKGLTQYSYYLPGHGELEENIQETIQVNINKHTEILTIIETFVKSKNHVSLEEIMEHVLSYYMLTSNELGKWLLYRTSILGYLRSLLAENRVSYQIINHRLVFQ